MAEKQGNETIEADSTQEESDSSLSDITNEEKDEASSEKPEKRSGPKNKTGKFASILKHKWALMISLLSVFAVTGLGLEFSPKLLNRFAMEKHVIALSEIKDEDLKEEVLDPFYIPLSPGSSTTVARVDLSLICDSLASVLFKRKELQIREQLYRDISTIADESDNLASMTDLLEMRISMTFKEFLGLQNLIVKIKEIKCF